MFNRRARTVRYEQGYPATSVSCSPETRPSSRSGGIEMRQLEVGDMTRKKEKKADTGERPKMKRKEYESQMRTLHGELVAMQEWVKDAGAKLCVVFEGRDTAGKGGTIKR